MVHDYHEGLTNYLPLAIWQEGCTECENRSATLPYSLATLDSESFARAWQRAAAWNRDDEIGHVSKAEWPLLSLLGMMQVMFERECGLPLGELPFARVTRAMQ